MQVKCYVTPLPKHTNGSQELPTHNATNWPMPGESTRTHRHPPLPFFAFHFSSKLQNLKTNHTYEAAGKAAGQISDILGRKCTQVTGPRRTRRLSGNGVDFICCAPEKEQEKKATHRWLAASWVPCGTFVKERGAMCSAYKSKVKLVLAD